MEVIIFGAPGVGKGTQAKIISKELNIKHISTGDMLRDAVKKGTELGLKAKSIMEAGELVPDELMCGIVEDVLKDDSTKNGFILDGFPRTLNQAILLNDILNKLDRNKIKLVQLDADDQVIIDRLTSRRVCSSCGNIVNLQSGIDVSRCPSCNSENSYIQRDDDKEDVIKNRLKVYKDSTLPIINYYKDKAEIIAVNGTDDIQNITKNILAKLK